MSLIPWRTCAPFVDNNPLTNVRRETTCSPCTWKRLERVRPLESEGGLVRKHGTNFFLPGCLSEIHFLNGEKNSTRKIQPFAAVLLFGKNVERKINFSNRLLIPSFR